MLRKSAVYFLTYATLLLAVLARIASANIGDIEYGANVEYPEYSAQKVLFEFYFDEPEKITSALYWVRSVMQTLSSSPYNHAPDDIGITIVIHGTEIVTLAKNNYPQYANIVERLRYYADLGVKIKLCSQAAEQYGYSEVDFPNFVDMIPAAVAELIYWQTRGYALVTPRITEKKFSIEEIR